MLLGRGVANASMEVRYCYGGCNTLWRLAQQQLSSPYNPKMMLRTKMGKTQFIEKQPENSWKPSTDCALRIANGMIAPDRIEAFGKLRCHVANYNSRRRSVIFEEVSGQVLGNQGLSFVLLMHFFAAQRFHRELPNGRFDVRTQLFAFARTRLRRCKMLVRQRLSGSERTTAPINSPSSDIFPRSALL